MKKLSILALGAVLVSSPAFAGFGYDSAFVGGNVNYTNIKWNKATTETLKDEDMGKTVLPNKNTLGLGAEAGVKFNTPVEWYQLGLTGAFDWVYLGEEKMGEVIPHSTGPNRLESYFEAKYNKDLYIISATADNYFRVVNTDAYQGKVLFGLGYAYGLDKSTLTVEEGIRQYTDNKLEFTGRDVGKISKNKNLHMMAFKLGYESVLPCGVSVLAGAKMYVPLTKQSKLVPDGQDDEVFFTGNKADMKYIMNIGLGVRYNF